MVREKRKPARNERKKTKDRKKEKETKGMDKNEMVVLICISDKEQEKKGSKVFKKEREKER